MLTDAQVFAIAYRAIDPEGWIERAGSIGGDAAILEGAAQGIREIQAGPEWKLLVDDGSDGETIDDIVARGREAGVLKTAAERQIEADAALAEEREKRKAEEAAKPRTVQVSDILRDLTDDQYDAIDTAMQTLSSRLRRLWASATEIRSDGELWQPLRDAVSTSVSEKKAVELFG